MKLIVEAGLKKKKNPGRIDILGHAHFVYKPDRDAVMLRYSTSLIERYKTSIKLQTRAIC